MKLTQKNQPHFLEKKTSWKKYEGGLQVLSGHPVQRYKTIVTKVSFIQITKIA